MPSVKHSSRLALPLKKLLARVPFACGEDSSPLKKVSLVLSTEPALHVASVAFVSGTFHFLVAPYKHRMHKT